MQNYKLSVIVPVYNEEKNIPPLIERLKSIIADLGCKYEIIFSLDPCSDKTEEVILGFRKNDKNIKLIKMSRRFGQPACTLAGIRYCDGDICVVIDADLQDPPELIKEMVVKWKEGYHVVYAQRRSRKGETLIKKIVASLGYKLINRISEVHLPVNTGDFRLMSREVIEYLNKMNENDAFLRGLVGYVGFNQIGLNGVLSFSKYPLSFISIMGLIVASFSFMLGIVYVVLSFLHIKIPWGNPTMVILLSFYSGIQLLSLGIIGQYLARMFDEVKKRPIFIVQEAHGFDSRNRAV